MHPGQLPVHPHRRAEALALLVEDINTDKQEVIRLAQLEVHKIIVKSAHVCGLRWSCPATHTMELVTTIKEVRNAWFANGGPANTMRIAWILYYFPTVLYLQGTAGTRHQVEVERTILNKMQVEYLDEDRGVGNMRSRTAIQQVYTMVFNHVRANMLRKSNVANRHKVGVSIEKPKEGNFGSRRRRKTEFFISDRDSRVEKVRGQHRCTIATQPLYSTCDYCARLLGGLRR